MCARCRPCGDHLGAPRVRCRQGNRRRQGLADVQPRCLGHALQSQPRRRSIHRAPVGSRRNGGSPRGARTTRSASSTPRLRWSTATSTSAQPPSRRFTSSRRTARSAGAYRRQPLVGKAQVSKVRLQSSDEGIMTSPLVTVDTVYFADLGGWIYALDRSTGAERWKLNTRGKDFPGAHPINLFFAGPLIVDGKLIVAGGALEQVFAASPFYKGSTGRGFIVALDPKTGKCALEIRPRPQARALEARRSRSRTASATTPFTTGRRPARSGARRRSTPRPARSSSAPTSTPRPGGRRPTIPGCTRASRARSSRSTSPRERRSGSRRSIRATSGPTRCASYDPKEGRYKDQSIGDTPKIYTIPVEGKPTKVVGVGCKNGGFYVLQSFGRHASSTSTPVYTGPPTYPLSPDARPTDARLAELYRRLADRLRDRRPHDLHQRHRRALARFAREGRRQRRAADRRARRRDQSGHKDRALAARAAQGAVDRRPAAQAHLHQRRRPGRLGHRGGQWRRLFHRGRQRQAGRPRRRHRVPSSRKSTSGRSGQAPLSHAAASTSAPAIRCSPRGLSSRSSPRSTRGELYSFGLPGDDEISRMGAGTE